MNFIEALQYPIIQNAVFAGLLASIACGIMGTYIVVKRLVFITGGISHASFGGIGFAFWAGIEPLLGAMLFAVASAFGIGALGKETLKREDTAIGIIWVIGMALGSFFMYFTPGYAVNLSSYLFGSLTLITEMDLYFLIVLAEKSMNDRSITNATAAPKSPSAVLSVTVNSLLLSMKISNVPSIARVTS